MAVLFQGSANYSQREKCYFYKIYQQILPQNIWVILDSGESDYKDNLADVMEDLGTEFVVKENEDKHEKQVKEDNSLDSPNYNQPHAIVQKSNSAGDTDVQNKCLSKKNKSVRQSLQIT